MRVRHVRYQKRKRSKEGEVGEVGEEGEEEHDQIPKPNIIFFILEICVLILPLFPLDQLEEGGKNSEKSLSITLNKASALD